MVLELIAIRRNIHLSLDSIINIKSNKLFLYITTGNGQLNFGMLKAFNIENQAFPSTFFELLHAFFVM